MIATGGLGGLLVLAGLVGGMWLRGAAERQARSQHPQAVANQREHPPLTPARLRSHRLTKINEAAQNGQLRISQTARRSTSDWCA